MSSTEDPENGPAVAGTIFSAVIVYAVRHVTLGFRDIHASRCDRRLTTANTSIRFSSSSVPSKHIYTSARADLSLFHSNQGSGRWTTSKTDIETETLGMESTLRRCMAFSVGTGLYLVFYRETVHVTRFL